MSELEEKMPMLVSMAKGIARQFGDKCEVIVHNYNLPFEKSIVYIENGHVSGRSVGQGGTNIGLRILNGEELDEGRYNYLTRTANGKVLRSTTIFIKDKEENNIGSLCINFDISDLMMASSILNEFTNPEGMVEHKETKEVEENLDLTIYNEIDDLLNSLINDSIKYVGVPVNFMTREQKIIGIKYLRQRGAFHVKKAGERIAEYYDVSKYTVYNYLNELDEE